MQLEWDESKRETTLRKRGIDFAVLEEAFNTEVFMIEQRRGSYDESRYVLFGFLQGKPIVVVYTYRGESVRIISARHATKHEQKTYYT